MPAIYTMECMANEYIERNDPAWIETAQKWAQVKAQMALLEKEEKELRAELIRLSERMNSTGGGVKLLKSIRRGTVQYGEIPELANVNLDRYRKPPMETFTLTKTTKA